MIGIRADANRTIASGHIMRCLSIADALFHYGENCLFFVSEKEAEELVLQRGFPCICLSTIYNRKNDELNLFIPLILHYKINCLLVDSYEVTKLYMQKLREFTKLAYIDDLNLFQYPADMIVNYTCNASKTMYTRWNYPKDIIFLLGSKYVPLRMEFSSGPIEIRNEVHDILFTTGNSDPLNIMVRLLDMWNCKHDSSIILHLIIGKFYGQKEQLKKRALESSCCICHDYSNDIASIMRKCDLAVSAGGTTVAELCALGIPTIAFGWNESQMGIFEYEKTRIIAKAINIKDNMESKILQLIELIDKLCTDYAYRKTLSENSKTKIDGCGAYRIAEKLASFD